MPDPKPPEGGQNQPPTQPTTPQVEVVHRPAPAPTPAPQPLREAPPPPQDWQGPQRAWVDTWTARQQREEAERIASEARQQAAEAQRQLDEMRAQRAALARVAEDQRMDMVMLEAGGDLKHPDVQRFFRDQYRAATSGAEQAPAFHDWFGSPQVRESPLFSRFFPQPPATPAAPDFTQPGIYPAPQPTQPAQPPTQVAPVGYAGQTAAPAAPTPPPPPPNPNAGVGPGTPPAHGVITDAQIARWSRDPEAWGNGKSDAARKALEAKYGRAIGSRPRKPRGE